MDNALLFFKPNNFIDAFKNIHPNFKDGQQDVMEFMRILLEDLNKENNIIKNIPPHELIDNDFKDKKEVYNDFKNYLFSRENSFISNKFYILLINTFICSCGYKSYNVDNILDIPLILPTDEKEINLINLIKENFDKTYIEWNGNCVKCRKKNKKHYKQISLGNINDFLFISIQRYKKNSSNINNTKVIFKNILDLNEVIDNEIFKGSSKFELISIIDHLGNIDYGHYYSYIKLNEDWVKFDDIIVENKGELDMISSKVCVLLYKRQG